MQNAVVFFLVLLMDPMVALSAVVHLSCSVTALPGGLVQYQLSPGLPQDCTEPSWENENKTVMAFRSEVDQKLVQNLTEQTLTLKKCLDYTHFTANCNGFVEAHCRMNCSSVSDPAPPPRSVVEPSHQICFGKSCVDVSVVVAPLCLLLLLAAGLGFWRFPVPKFRRWRRRRFQGRATEDLELQETDPETKVALVDVKA